MQLHFKLFSTVTNLNRLGTRMLSRLGSAVVLLVFLSFSVFLSPAAPAHAQGAVLSPQQVVEYALTLEKLEADFYRRATAAMSRNGSLANAPRPAKDAITAYGRDEAQHVTDLSAVLRSIGGNPDAVTIPANPNYNAILGRNPFANLRDFLLALQRVEDLGVAAYKGQVQNLLTAGATTILAGALEIHTVEARHAAGIRYLRQELVNADIRPWIRRSDEVIYPENRPGTPINFADAAFDGFATSDEVLALVGPILGATPPAPPSTSSPSGLEGSITQDDCPSGTTLELVSGGYICRPAN